MMTLEEADKILHPVELDKVWDSMRNCPDHLDEFWQSVSADDGERLMLSTAEHYVDCMGEET